MLETNRQLISLNLSGITIIFLAIFLIFKSKETIESLNFVRNNLTITRPVIGVDFLNYQITINT